MKRLIKLIPVMIILFSSLAQAQTYKETLKGLKGVNVYVVDLKPDIEKDVLRRSSIQTDVEIKLRIAGIKVLTRIESLKEPGDPLLCVNVNSFKTDVGLYAYSISVELNQYVILERDKNIWCRAVTWHSAVIGIVGGDNVNRLRDIIKDQVDHFINDYLEMNPKE